MRKAERQECHAGGCTNPAVYVMLWKEPGHRDEYPSFAYRCEECLPNGSTSEQYMIAATTGSRFYNTTVRVDSVDNGEPVSFWKWKVHDNPKEGITNA